MNVVLIAAVLIGLAIYLAGKFKPGHMARFRSLWRSQSLTVGIAVVAALALTGRIGLAVGAASLLYTLVRMGVINSWNAPTSKGRKSRIASPMVSLTLDAASGQVSGEVLKGRWAGLSLATLDASALADLHRETATDARSRAVLEIYLDSRLPGWREHMQAEAATGRGRAADSGSMSEQEAYEILGLHPGAGEADIRAAHRRLMKKVHPDQGGTTFLAVRINQAKDRLLSKHR
ncbi:DnaJ domain-containing protein [Oryzibacter oryziterrae]|uniref:DnaJ domain-containing protein n=1 Tax=Oryzibacter oryziterrae TaxID=2766474 RepID=UPI001F38CB93|nr:DnaJ domain-containing protein [Oryzibacter oryziterrae]